MAKANIVLPDGTTVVIEGSVEEVSALLARFSESREEKGKASSTRKKIKTSSAGRSNPKSGRGLTSLITELSDSGFFKSKRSLSDIQKKLEELGHIYAITSISPCLTRMTKSRTLRRVKENKVWMYVS